MQSTHSAIPVEANFEGVTDALGKIRDIVASYPPVLTRVDEIELALAEVLNNVVEHAVIDLDHPLVAIQIEVSADRCCFTVTDNGPPFKSPEAADAADRSAHSALNMGEGGFGWHLVHTLTDNLKSWRCDGANHLDLEFSLQPNSKELTYDETI